LHYPDDQHLVAVNVDDHGVTDDEILMTVDASISLYAAETVSASLGTDAGRTRRDSVTILELGPGQLAPAPRSSESRCHPQ